MRISLAFRAAGPVLAMILAGCSDEPADPNEVPPPGTVRRWSDPATWPGRALPAAGSAVTIPESTTVLLDVSPPSLASLTIEGTLRFDETRDLDLTAGWIMVHGRLEVGTEARPFTRRAVITLTGPASDDIMGMGAKVLGVMGGELDMHGEPRAGWTRLNVTAAAGATQIVLERSMGWRAGDRIVIASTDLNPLQAEEAVVASVQGATVTLQAALRFAHWGAPQTFANRTLDERAEVGLLTRNIVVRGDSASLAQGFGGHVMVMQGGEARIEGVELTRMGQKRTLARYPMHWHLSGSVTGQYFRQNSVWKTFNRCLTVHGTDDALVSGNVCYDHIGHGLFLEDGAETGNVIEGNLGLLTRRPASGEALLPSDVTPATFWLTNPANVVRGNASAGSQGFGFWYALPIAPTGLSTGAPDRPRQTPLGEFSDNVAHSNSNTGLNVDHGPRPDGTIETAHYAPRQVPGANSPAVTAWFRNFTGYKHSGRAVWLRGTELRLSDAMIADNAIGATFASSETFVLDAVFVGQSANGGGTQIGATFPIRGYEFYDGRVGAERVTFVNFPTGGRTMSALGFNRTNGFPVSTGNYGKELTFQNANAVFLENPAPDKDGDKAAVILDADGTVTGTAGAFVAANNPLLITPGCQRRDAWNAWICPSPFVQLQIRGANSQPVAPLNLIRDDAVGGNFVGVPSNPQTVVASLVPGRGYAVQYLGPVPDRPQFYLNRSNPGDWIRITAPYPSASFDVFRDFGNTRMPAATSLAELDAGTGNLYFYDAASSLLHLKLVTQAGRNFATQFVVPR
ncbi:MAG: G8 domain-containing protein [Gemmatimonadales bacterium]